MAVDTVGIVAAVPQEPLEVDTVVVGNTAARIEQARMRVVAEKIAELELHNKCRTLRNHKVFVRSSYNSFPYICPP